MGMCCAEPGPACYNLGGSEPTVTDADLALGYLDADNFLGGRMKLSKPLALQAIKGLADDLAIDPVDLAWGICEVVNENMAAAARVHIAEKGLDPRTLTMVATGGAGPVHAVEIAHKLGIDRILCTIAAGLGSCLGFLSAPARVDRVSSRAEFLDDAQAVLDVAHVVVGEFENEQRLRQRFLRRVA
jgi:N-methylhydantoinase A